MPKNKGAAYFAEREGYSVRADADTETAELVLYGQVVRRRPFNGFTGKPVEGYFIVEDEILDDLNAVSKSKALNIRLNSCGGECHTAIVIHNRLREMAKNGTQITCTVDGVAMSAGSHIMCAADTVKASEGSLIMIHKSLVMLAAATTLMNSEKPRSQTTLMTSLCCRRTNARPERKKLNSSA